MAHEDAHEHAAIASILLLRTVLNVLISERSLQDLRQLVGSHAALAIVGAAKGVIVECNTVNNGNEKQ